MASIADNSAEQEHGKVFRGLRDAISKLDVTKRARDILEDWEVNSTSINILVTGKTGTGKSTLVNAIVGECVAEEGHELDPKTSKVTSYEHKIGDVVVTVWDSPGLQDGTTREDEYRQDIKEKCKEIDLMIYCIQMSETRLLPPDINAMIKLTNTLGTTVWSNAIVILTFANDIVEFAELKFEDEKEQHSYFNDKLDEWTRVVRHHMCTDLQMSAQKAEKVPVLPAGTPEVEELPDPASDTQKSYWLSELWIEALKVTRFEAQPALIKLNSHRMMYKSQLYKNKEVESRRKVIDSIPLVFCEKGAEEGCNKIGPLGKVIGGMIGYSFGVGKSLILMLDIAIKSKVIKVDGDENSVSTC